MRNSPDIHWPKPHNPHRHLACIALLTLTALPMHPTQAADEDCAPLAFVENKLLPPVFKQGEVARPDGSKMVYFLGNFKDDLSTKKPLMIYLEGSGAQSHFTKIDDRIGYGIFGLMAQHAGDNFHVATIDKRGVEFGDAGRRGSGEGASAEYNQHATLADRVADVRLLLDTLLAAPCIDPSLVLVVGHSEGADVGAATAAADPRITHLAFLSGGGAAQLYDFYLMRRKEMTAAGATPEEINEAINALEADIRKMLANPDSTDEFWMGHAYRRWSTFATTASADNLVRTQARLFLAHGTEDTSVPIESFDFLVVNLLCHGKKDFVVRRVVGGDHSYIRKGEDPSSEPFLKVLQEVTQWAQPGATSPSTTAEK